MDCCRCVQSPAVFYIPRSDIRIEHYARTEHQTHYPYKGRANYLSLGDGAKTAENAVWTYEDTYPTVAQIKELGQGKNVRSPASSENTRESTDQRSDDSAERKPDDQHLK
ncbi:DUF427 domain-containing protein [Pseudomonas sp. H3(2019)]|uniref:DUF427 domain-containing protein n=1 Tax=Pseudomonas sp. H3(2019) TaxID=2598724 RepID=UPI003531E08B